MNQDRYFTNSNISKPLTTSEGIENRKYSGNPLLRQVDEELKRLRSQFDKVASNPTSVNQPTTSTNSGNYASFSNYYSSSASPQTSKIERVEEQPRSSYATDSYQPQTFTSQRQNYHRDTLRYGATETSTPQGLSSYGYQASNGSAVNTSGSFTSSTNGYGISNQNVNANSQRISGSGIMKNPSNNASLEFKSPKNLTNSGRYVDSQQIQSQVNQPVQPVQPVQSVQPTTQSSQLYQTSYQSPSPVQTPEQVSPQSLSQGFPAPVSPSIPIVEVLTGEKFKLPNTKPQLVKVSSPQSETIRINSPSKIKSGPSPSEISRAQQQSRRVAQMLIIEKQRELARQFQQQTARLRQQRERATIQRRQKEQRQASISKTELGNYVTNINDKNKKISQLENKINQMTYQIANSENQAKRYKLQIESLKNNHKVQLQGANTTITNLKRQVDLLNRQKDRKNVDLENKMNKVNFSYEEVNATNNRLNREIEALKREVEKKTNTTEVNQNVFQDFKLKINQKTHRINELEKELDQVAGQRNQLRKRVDELLLQGYQPKRQFNLEKLDKQPGAFDEILKMNLEENQTYKSNLSVKDQEIFRLQQINRTLRGQNERMKNQIEIEKLKRMTQLKNIQTTMDIEVQVKQNEVNSLNHVIASLEEKLKFVVQEDRKKDQFMVTYLKGRAESAEEKQSIDEFFKQFELLSVNTNITECLKREQTEIQRLKEEIQRIYTQRR